MREPLHEHELHAKIEKLKDQTPHREKYPTPESQELIRALDILAELRMAVHNESATGYEKLLAATIHLEGLLKRHIQNSRKR